MDIAIVLYEGLTALDAIGPYEVFGRVPGTTVTFVANEAGPLRTDTGRLGLHADAALADVTAPDLVLVPGGPGQAAAMHDEDLFSWLRRVDETTQWTTSVCTGSLILAGAGLLTGKRATTHWLAMEELARLGADAVAERVVFDGKLVTAAGVSAGIDMALALVARMHGDAVAQAIQLGIEYDPQPPFDAGSPAKAPAEVVEFLRQYSRFEVEPA
jgi:transcriptional regulator GlxA family with amidase domain